MRSFSVFIVVAFLANSSVFGSPVIQEDPAVNSEESDESDVGNATIEETHVHKNGRDLYVIRKVVYEIGILTDADNSTDFDNKTHEQIDVSFFDPIDNGTFVDLSNIPTPVETNVSGVALTGIIPSNFGNLVFPPNSTVASLNESSFPLFPEKQVRVTKEISTGNQEQSANILSDIRDILGL